MSMPRFLLDEHVWGGLVQIGQELGTDVLLVQTRLAAGADDEAVLAFTASQGRILLTSNAQDFAPLVAAWFLAEREHWGVIIVPGQTDRSLLSRALSNIDRDSTFTAAFDQYMRDSGVEPVLLPPKSPNLNAHCERFVRSSKEEALDRMIFMGEASLRYAIRCYLSHYHAERNHQGLSNALITPETEVGRTTGRVKRRKHLGDLLSYYHREAA